MTGHYEPLIHRNPDGPDLTIRAVCDVDTEADDG